LKHARDFVDALIAVRLDRFDDLILDLTATRQRLGARGVRQDGDSYYSNVGNTGSNPVWDVHWHTSTRRAPRAPSSSASEI